MTKTILVPLDGSELGEKALPWAIQLAQHLGISLTLVRAVPWLEFPVSQFGGYITAETYDQIVRTDHTVADEYLTGKQAELSNLCLSVNTVMRDGAAAEVIHDVADEIGAYAVVMASHGHGGVKRFVLGSVGERLFEQATIPILLVRATERTQAPSLHQVLVPLDGSTFAERAIDQALEVVGMDGLLVLLRVVEPIYDAVGGGDLTSFVLDEDATRRAEDEARNYLHRTAASLSARGHRVETRLHRGRPATQILESTGEINPDVIVMTTHGRSGPARWLMGSVADEVFRSTDLPVFMVSVRAVLSGVKGAFAVREFMTHNPEVMREDEPLVSAARKIVRRHISGAPVVDAGGKLIGMVSEYDLLGWHERALNKLAKNESDLDPTRYGALIETQSIAPIVTRPAASIDQDADMSSALRLMLERKIRRLPVTSGGRLVGIISRGDILRAMANHWSAFGSANGEPSEVARP
jgi:nucleotide-binding universal stress UspA family protein/predicted transcriptional regulator